MSTFEVSTSRNPSHPLHGQFSCGKVNREPRSSPVKSAHQGFWTQERVTFRCQGKPSKQSSTKKHLTSSPTSEREFGFNGATPRATSLLQDRAAVGRAPNYGAPTRMTNIWRCSSHRDGFRKAKSPTSAEEAKARRSELANRPLSGCSGFIDRPHPLPIVPETRRHSWD